jgi:hypothetical protein
MTKVDICDILRASGAGVIEGGVFGSPEAVQCLLSFRQRAFATAAATICPRTIFWRTTTSFCAARALPKNIKSDIL